MSKAFLRLVPWIPIGCWASAISWENGQSTSVVYVSRDGGRHWNRSASFRRGVRGFSGGDLIVYFDTTGAVADAGGIEEMDHTCVAAGDAGMMDVPLRIAK